MSDQITTIPKQTYQLKRIQSGLWQLFCNQRQCDCKNNVNDFGGEISNYWRPCQSTCTAFNLDVDANTIPGKRFIGLHCMIPNRILEIEEILS